jgi:hypothetical protein
MPMSSGGFNRAEARWQIFWSIALFCRGCIPCLLTNSTQNRRFRAPFDQFPFTRQNKIDFSFFTGLADPDILDDSVRGLVLVFIHDLLLSTFVAGALVRNIRYPENSYSLGPDLY